MSTRLLFLAVYLAYALASNGLTKQGSGLDPMGLTAPTPPPATSTSDQGRGFDPWG
jgi:hypothetical protein